MSEMTQDSWLCSKEYRRNNLYTPTAVRSLWVILPDETRNFTGSSQETKLTRAMSFKTDSGLQVDTHYLLSTPGYSPPVTGPHHWERSLSRFYFILIRSFWQKGKPTECENVRTIIVPPNIFLVVAFLTV